MSATAPLPRSMPWLRTCLVVLFVTTAVRSWRLYAGLPDHPYFTASAIALALLVGKGTRSFCFGRS